MPVPSKISDLSPIASANSPAGTESVKGTIDNYLRTHGAFIRQISDQVLGSSVPLASAATVPIGFAKSINVLITGTTQVSSFDDAAEGLLRWVAFSDALTLVHNGAKIALPGAASIITANGDIALFKCLGGAVWRCVGYFRASGTGTLSATETRDGYLTAADFANFAEAYANAKDLPGTSGAAAIGTANGKTVEERLADTLSVTTVGDGTVPVFSVGAPSPGVTARYQVTKAVTAHADYGYLYNSTVTYAQAGFQAHASFNDNVKFSGTQDSDHHHSFQSYPHYGGTGTLGRLSCFWAQPDVTAGTVTELSQFKVSNPLGSGTISSLYGLYVEPLTRGTANYAIYVAGTTVSYFGGALALGQIANPAFVMYNPNSGNLDLTPRTGYGVAVVGGPLLFGADTGAPAKLAYNPNGNLDITPRAGYSVSFTSGAVLVGASTPVAGEKLNTTGSVGDFIVRHYNSHPTAPKGAAIVYTGAAPNGTGNEFLYCQDSAAIRLKILSNGNVQNVNNSYGALSDAKLKENVVGASAKLADLLRVRIVNYNLIGDPDHKQLGVIAQELAAIFPGMVEETIDYADVEVEPARTITTTTSRQKTAPREETHMVPTLVDGQWRNVPTPITVDAPVFDEHPLFDKNGAPLMELAEPEQPERRDARGNVTQPFRPAIYSDRQRVHQVPVMEDVKESIDVPATFERRPTGTTTLSVKYSVFVPMLIKALQEQQAQIDAINQFLKASQ